jgi:hypothetical protein
MAVTNVLAAVLAAITTLFVSLAPPVYAALDLTPFATLAAAMLTGGIVHAYNQYKKTPAEVESISVASLSNALEQLRMENTRILKRLEDCERRSR